MGSSFGATCEIVEDKDGLSSFRFPGRTTILPNSGPSSVDKDLENPVLKLGYKGSLEDDINQLFESISLNTSGMISSQQVGTAASRNMNPSGKNTASKKPAGPRPQGAGTSELKQALRDLCISKASESAAMKRVSEGGRVKNLYGSVLVESKKGPGVHVDESKALMVEILGESKRNHSENSSKQPQNSPRFAVEATQHEGKGIMMMQKGNESFYRNHGDHEIDMEIMRKAKNVYVTSESHPNSEDEGPEKTVPSLAGSSNEKMSVRKVRLLHMAPASTTATGKRVGKLTRSVSKPMLRNKVSVKKKIRQNLYPVSVYDEVDGFYDPITKHLLCHRCHSALRNTSKEESDHNLQPQIESFSLAVEKVITEDGWNNLNPGVKRYITERLSREFSSLKDHDKDIAEDSNKDLSGFDRQTLDVQKIIAEEPNQDFIGSENSKAGLKKDIAEEINEDFRGLGSLILGGKNFGAEEGNHTSSSSHVVSGALNTSPETSQDSLASFFVDNSCGIGLDCASSDVEDTSKEATKHSLLPANHSDEICSVDSESSARTSLDNIVQSNIEEVNKGKLSQGSKEIIEKFTGTTSIVSEINRSSFGNRPHMSKDLRWDAIRHVRTQQGVLGLKHFNLLKKLGGGDIGTVYLAELIGTNCLFAIKVLDNEYLERRNKIARAQTERDILKMLDHPFLPTLYSHFTSDDLSCLVMEYCPGGDLHVLRQKQPARCFPEPSARFYVAEVLLALEYLHMLGVIYRDLKPENILVREDGHIMVTDFDLSLRCAVSPTLYNDPIRLSSHIAHSSCIDPFCIQPSLRVPSFIPRLLPATKKEKKKKKLKPKKAELLSRLRSLPQLVAEPTDARSNSFVGTHEYLAPEIIKGDGHGASVDWWTFGVLLYELLYGKTPFNGSTDDETLANVVLQNLKFPDSPAVSFQAKDLIRGLLVKEPENRVGSVKGATDIKRHPFFEGLNWALIRCAIPPELPDAYEYEVSDLVSQDGKSSFLESKAAEEHIEFELF